MRSMEILKKEKGKWLRLCLFGFVFGLVNFAVMDRFSALFAIMLSMIGAGIVLYRKMRVEPSAILVFACFALFGFGFADDRVTSLPPPLTAESYEVEGVVKRIQLNERIRLKVGEILLNGESVDGSLFVYVPLYPRHTYGSTIRFTCTIVPPQSIEGFRYDRFLATQGVVGSCFLKESPFIIASPKKGGMTIIHEWRTAVIKKLDAVFGEPHASLVAGLYFGEQRFSEDWAERFRITGTTHVVAASGYNVSLVASLLFTFAIALGFWRRQAFFGIVIGIVIYAILAGLDPPIIRASIMGALVLCAKQLGRKADLQTVLLLTFGGMLMLEPRLVTDHIGFQLSALSTLALIYLSPKVEPWMNFVPETGGLREGFTATVTATIATLPISILTFGGFSVIAPIANLFLLPFLPYIMFFALPAFFFPSFLAVLFTAPATWIMNVLFLGIRAFASLSFAYREVSPITLAVIGCSIMILLLHVWKLNRKH